jgi:hypothetical protein
VLIDRDASKSDSSLIAVSIQVVANQPPQIFGALIRASAAFVSKSY